MQSEHIKTLEQRIEVINEHKKHLNETITSQAKQLQTTYTRINNKTMNNQTTKQELIKLILSLDFQQYSAFKDNYSIKGSRELLQFIEDLRDEEEEQEIVSEILINISIE